MGTIVSYAWSITSGSDKVEITNGANAATVSIKCNLAGTATIKLVASDGSKEAEATATITVVDSTADISDTTDGATLYLGTAENTKTFMPTVTPHGNISTDLVWTSSNAEIASVSESGLVTGVTAGPVTITATTASGAKKDYAVEVKAPDSIKVTAPTKVEYDVGEAFDKTGLTVKAILDKSKRMLLVILSQILT